MGFESPSHWVILIIIAALLFGGYKRLPEMSRSVGRSLRIFKTEMKGMTDDDEAREAAEKAKPCPRLSSADVPVVPVSPQVPPVAVPPAANQAPVSPEPTARPLTQRRRSRAAAEEVPR